MDLVAVSERIADTLRRSAPLMAAVRRVEWGSAPSYTYGDEFPLVRAMPGRTPVTRREHIGTGGDPDRHQPQLTQAAMEVAVVTDSHAFTQDAQRSAWGIARLVESALAANVRLADADGGDALCHGLELGTVSSHAPTLGKGMVAVTVMATVLAYEDLVILNSADPEEGEG